MIRNILISDDFMLIDSDIPRGDKYMVNDTCGFLIVAFAGIS